MARWTDRRRGSYGRLFAEESAMAHLACVLADSLPADQGARGQVAQEAGVSARLIDDILTADGDISVRTVARIAHALGLRVRVTLEPALGGGTTCEPGT